MVRAGDVAGMGRPTDLQASADFVSVAFHGMAVSHIDALCHVFVDGEMYNGIAASEVTSIGARRNSIAAAWDGIVGRGVLLDIPRLRGVKWLEPASVITPGAVGAAVENDVVAADGPRRQGALDLMAPRGRIPRVQREGPARHRFPPAPAWPASPDVAKSAPDAGSPQAGRIAHGCKPGPERPGRADFCRCGRRLEGRSPPQSMNWSRRRDFAARFFQQLLPENRNPC
jgi:hypothetical protein